MNEGEGLWDPLGRWPEARRWVWATAAFWACVLQGPKFVENLWESRDVLPDFFQEWASARNWREGLPIYTSHRVTIPRYLGSLSETMHPLVQVNAHPPTSVLLALPLARLDFHAAFFVWNVASLVAFGVGLWLVVRELGMTLSAWAIFPFLALFLTCSPVWQEIHMGQLSMVLVPLVTGAWAAERSGRPRLAGALLATATAIKLFPGFLFLYYALRRRWDVVAWGLVALVALTCVTMATLGIGCYRDYVLNVVPEVHWFRVGWNNASLTGFWSRLFDPAPERIRDRSRSEPIVYSPALARACAWATSAAVVAVLAWAVRRARTIEERDIAFGLAVTAMLLVSPITWDHYFVLLALPLALTWLRLPRSVVARASFLAIVAALWTLPALVYTITDVGGHVAAPWQSATIVSYQTHALVGLFVLGIVELRAPWAGRALPSKEEPPA